MKRMIGFIVAVALIGGGFLGGNFLQDAFWADAASDAPSVGFEIPSGASVKQIANQLEELELIESSQAFEWFMKLFGDDVTLQAGTFNLPQGLSFESIVKALRRATTEDVQVTFPEGLTLEQIGDKVRAALPHITEGEWREATDQHSSLFTDEEARYLLPEDGTLEGYLFPDTYRFSVEAEAPEVVRIMWETFLRRLDENEISVSSRDLSIKLRGESYTGSLTFHEVIILASIIEREVRGREDMREVADIFLKRLKIGQALQADSTINYVTGKKTPSVSAADLEIDSLYNTYKHPGLTPGPISHPGIDAILAVLDPASNDYFYFLTTPEGEVKYAETFDQHIANRRFLR